MSLQIQRYHFKIFYVFVQLMTFNFKLNFMMYSSSTLSANCICLQPQSIVVRWEPPPDGALNGIITGYKIRYRKQGDRIGETVTCDGVRRIFDLTGWCQGVLVSRYLKILPAQILQLELSFKLIVILQEPLLK